MSASLHPDWKAMFAAAIASGLDVGDAGRRADEACEEIDRREGKRVISPVPVSAGWVGDSPEHHTWHGRER